MIDEESVIRLEAYDESRILEFLRELGFKVWRSTCSSYFFGKEDQEGLVMNFLKQVRGQAK